MIPGVEGKHAWTPPGASSVAFTLYPDNTEYDSVWPRATIEDVTIQDLPEASDDHDPKVGAAGASARESVRRTKLVTYTGTIRGRNFLELRDHQQKMRTAFAGQSAEGKMDCSWPTGFPTPIPAARYFNAKALGLSMPDKQGSPANLSAGAERPFILALRNHAGRHYETLTLARFKASIVELGPALYWALDSVDLANDLSPNNRDGTGQGGITLGTASSLTAIPGDSATDFSGGKGVSSSYDPFLVDTVRSFCGIASANSSGGHLIGGSATATITPRLAVDADLDVQIAPAGSILHQWDDAWPGYNEPVVWALIFRGAGSSETAELFINGVSKGIIATTDDWGAGNFQAGFVGAPPPSPSFSGSQSHLIGFEGGLTAQEIADIHEWAALGRRGYW